MKKFLLIIFAFMPIVALAQDKIKTVDGKIISAKITEIGEDAITYKDFLNQDGPTYRLGIANIASIILENGSETVYNKVPEGFILPSQISVKRGDLYGDGVQIPESSYLYVLGKDELDSFNSGLKFRKAGKTLTFVGLGLTAVGGVIFGVALSMASKGELSSGDYSMAYPAGLGIGLGVSCLIASIPFNAVGKGKINAVVDNYNNNHKVSLNFGVTNNGIGLALNF